MLIRFLTSPVVLTAVFMLCLVSMLEIFIWQNDPQKLLNREKLQAESTTDTPGVDFEVPPPESGYDLEIDAGLMWYVDLARFIARFRMLIYPVLFFLIYGILRLIIPKVAV